MCPSSCSLLAAVDRTEWAFVLDALGGAVYRLIKGSIQADVSDGNDLCFPVAPDYDMAVSSYLVCCLAS